MIRTITTIRENFNEFGYAIEANFIQDQHDQGGMTYELILKERWEDGHFTYPSRRYKKFKNKEEGNEEYKKYLAKGFIFISKNTFVPTEMDMR